MAGGAAILSAYDEALKEFYLPGIQDMLNHDTYLADKIEVNEEDVSGLAATIECHYGRSGGVGSRADNAVLPTADYQKFKKMTVPMKYHYGSVSFSGPTIAATRDEKGAYARVIDTEIEGIVNDLKKEVNRQYWGCGYGILCRWYSDSSNDNYVQKRYANNAIEPDGAFGSTFGGKYLKENGWCVIVEPTWSSHLAASWTISATNMKVTAVTEGTYTDKLTVTTADGASAAAGDWYCRPANLIADTNVSASTAATVQSNRREMMGIRGIVTDTDLDDIAFTDDGTNTGFDSSTTDPLQGLTIGSYTWWKAIVDSHSSGRYKGQRALTLTLMQKMFDKVEIAAGKGYGPDSIMCAHPVRREYLELVQADRKIVNEMHLDGGWTGLDYNGVPLMVDVDAIDGEMYFLTMKEFQLYRMSDYDWMQKNGAILQRITTYDAYEATLFRYAELGCKRRNTQGVITDIAYEN